MDGGNNVAVYRSKKHGHAVRDTNGSYAGRVIRHDCVRLRGTIKQLITYTQPNLAAMNLMDKQSFPFGATDGFV